MTKGENRGSNSYFMFELSGTRSAIPSAVVQQMEQVENITPVPNAAEFVEGVVFSRGEVVPALNSGARLMPGMDGIALAEAIKSEAGINRTQTVLLTSAGESTQGVRSREAGISAFLSKPVRQSQLFDCLITVMSQGADRQTPTRTMKPKPKDVHKMSHKLILLAEDNVVNQKVAVRQMQKLGYRADAVANGREAVEALRQIPYDLVLMDCQMPEMDGYEATAEIRRQESHSKHTPIVAMTAHALAGDREKCIAAGMDDYITKPVKVEELYRVLTAYIAEPEAAPAAVDVSLAESELPPVDVTRMHDAMGTEPEEFSEILNLYLETMSQNLGRLDVALQCGNHEEVELAAHNGAGTSANCGMTAVVASLLELEQAGREGQLTNAPRALAQTKREFGRIQAFLETHMKQFGIQMESAS